MIKSLQVTVIQLHQGAARGELMYGTSLFGTIDHETRKLTEGIVARLAAADPVLDG